MAKLLPQDSFTIHSELSAEAIAARLNKSITTIPSFADAPIISIRWPWQKPEKPYEGKVTPQGFEASRIINHQNSFLPRIQGRFETLVKDSNPVGTAIQIKMTLHPWTMGTCIALELLWFCMIFLLIIHAAFNSITLMFMGVSLLVFGLAGLSFWAEARRSRRDLLQMIGGSLKVQ